VSTVSLWSGARGRPRKEDRCAAPLLASATPNALGAWFAPGRAGRLTDVAAWFCLASSRRDNAPLEEQRERLRETIRLFQGPQARRPAAPPAHAPTPFPANTEAPRCLGSSARRAPRAVLGAERARGARGREVFYYSLNFKMGVEAGRAGEAQGEAPRDARRRGPVLAGDALGPQNEQPRGGSGTRSFFLWRDRRRGADARAAATPPPARDRAPRRTAASPSHAPKSFQTIYFTKRDPPCAGRVR